MTSPARRRAPRRAAGCPVTVTTRDTVAITTVTVDVSARGTRIHAPDNHELIVGARVRVDLGTDTHPVVLHGQIIRITTEVIAIEWPPPALAVAQQIAALTDIHAPTR